MAYLLRGTNEAGDPVEVVVDGCWRCGAMINVMLVSLDEHVERAHPLPLDQGRHVLRDDH